MAKNGEIKKVLILLAFMLLTINVVVGSTIRVSTAPVVNAQATSRETEGSESENVDSISAELTIIDDKETDDSIISETEITIPDEPVDESQTMAPSPAEGSYITAFSVEYNDGNFLLPYDENKVTTIIEYSDGTVIRKPLKYSDEVELVSVTENTSRITGETYVVYEYSCGNDDVGNAGFRLK